MSSESRKEVSAQETDADIERQVFSAARQLDGSARLDFLNQACGHNRTLHQRIVKLLEVADTDSSDLLDRNFKSIYFELSGSRESETDSKKSNIEAVLALFEASDKSENTLGRVAHYEILDLIGRGAFGVVLKAFDEKLEREVAVKVLNPTLSKIPAYRERFLKEARAAASIQHPNVVKIHSVEEFPFPFIVMELINGETLQSRIRRDGPMSLQETVDVAIEIIQGLGAAHRQGLVHLDVKPSNILLDDASDGTTKAKLTDFGLALAIDDNGQVVPESILGTPAYMSPEQAKGEKIDQRADLFSVGSVIFTMCSGQAAFAGAETLSVMRGVMEAERVELPDGVRIPNRLSRIINRLHSTLPENRYRSANEVLPDLKRLSSSSKNRFLTYGLTGVAALVVSMLVAGVFLLFTGTNLLTEKPTWTQARQRLGQVTSDFEKADVNFDSDQCYYEIEDGKVTFLQMPYARNLSSLSQFTDVEYLILHPRDPEDPPVDISFLDSMKKLRNLELQRYPVKSLEPLRGLQLERLHLWYVQTGGQYYPSLVDLDPLKGMPLHWLNCGGCTIKSLQPLKNMELEFLCINDSTQVTDLSPLAGMPLQMLLLAESDAEDLTPLIGSPLQVLDISHSKVRDLSPLVHFHFDELRMNDLQVDNLEILKKCNIKVLEMDYDPSHEELVKSIPGLEVFNGKPLAEFFEANKKQ